MCTGGFANPEADIVVSQCGLAGLHGAALHDPTAKPWARDVRRGRLATHRHGPNPQVLVLDPGTVLIALPRPFIARAFRCGRRLNPSF